MACLPAWKLLQAVALGIVLTLAPSSWSSAKADYRYPVLLPHLELPDGSALPCGGGCFGSAPAGTADDVGDPGQGERHDAAQVDDAACENAPAPVADADVDRDMSPDVDVDADGSQVAAGASHDGDMEAAAPDEATAPDEAEEAELNRSPSIAHEAAAGDQDEDEMEPREAAGPEPQYAGDAGADDAGASEDMGLGGAVDDDQRDTDHQPAAEERLAEDRQPSEFPADADRGTDVNLTPSDDSNPWADRDQRAGHADFDSADNRDDGQRGDDGQTADEDTMRDEAQPRDHAVAGEPYMYSYPEEKYGAAAGGSDEMPSDTRDDAATPSDGSETDESAMNDDDQTAAAGSVPHDDAQLASDAEDVGEMPETAHADNADEDRDEMAGDRDEMAGDRDEMAGDRDEASIDEAPQDEPQAEEAPMTGASHSEPADEESTESTPMAVQPESGLELFASSPVELLLSPDQDLLRRLVNMSVRYGERRMALDEYVESLGSNAVSFSAQYERTTNRDVLDLADDLPSVAAFFAAFRLYEQDRLDAGAAIDILERTLANMPSDWTDGTMALLDSETPADGTPGLQAGQERMWNEIIAQGGRAAARVRQVLESLLNVPLATTLRDTIQSATAGRQNDAVYRTDSGEDPYQR